MSKGTQLISTTLLNSDSGEVHSCNPEIITTGLSDTACLKIQPQEKNKGTEEVLTEKEHLQIGFILKEQSYVT